MVVFFSLWTRLTSFCGIISVRRKRVSFIFHHCFVDDFFFGHFFIIVIYFRIGKISALTFLRNPLDTFLKPNFFIVFKKMVKIFITNIVRMNIIIRKIIFLDFWNCDRLPAFRAHNICVDNNCLLKLWFLIFTRIFFENVGNVTLLRTNLYNFS